MTSQSFYPVFETGQVLTSQNLNNILDYLKPQGEQTRIHLSGIGIVGGFKPDWDQEAGILTLSGGVAVTSEGYLIAQDAVSFNCVRDYYAPIPAGADVRPEVIAAARYPYLFRGADQLGALELLPTTFQPAPGDNAPAALRDVPLPAMCVMLFLERNLESLNNCSVNDCSDLGFEMNLTLRVLLVKRSDADRMLVDEQVVAGRPVDRANHPRRNLRRVELDKLNLRRWNVDTLGGLYDRIMDVAGKSMLELQPAMQNAWSIYWPLLGDMYRQNPVPPHLFLNMLAGVAGNPTLAQYFYGAVHDLVLAYNEFVTCAARFDAECNPKTGRFPLHVLAGDVAPRPAGFAGAPATLAEYEAYRPLDIPIGLAPEGLPAQRRHHFVPSLALDNGQDRLAELRSLFARMILLTQTFDLRGIGGIGNRLTPSQAGRALGDGAIPYCYRFEITGDLYKNWSWPAARLDNLGRNLSFKDAANFDTHPSHKRRDDKNFIRVEGLVGKRLDETLQDLAQQKRDLGLSFAVQPVFVDLPSGDAAKDQAARDTALKAMTPMLVCRMGELDLFFETAMSGIFAYMFLLVQTLGQMDVSKTLKATPSTSTQTNNGRQTVNVRAPDFEAQAFIKPLNYRNLQQTLARRSSEVFRTAYKQNLFMTDNLVSHVTDKALLGVELKDGAVAAIYGRISPEQLGGDLLARVSANIDDISLAVGRPIAVQAVYPSIALIAQANAMMKLVGAASLATFDEAAFAAAVRGFADAYDSYADQAETDPDKTDRVIAEVNGAIVAQRASILAATAQLSNGALTGELRARLKTAFEDLTLGRFTHLHPSLDHGGGTPVDGTLVVLYASYAAVKSGMSEAIAALAPGLRDLCWRLIGPGQTPGVDADKAIRELGSGPANPSGLNQFVVLGDFYLGYRCCDADCTETPSAGGTAAATAATSPPPAATTTTTTTSTPPAPTGGAIPTTGQAAAGGIADTAADTAAPASAETNAAIEQALGTSKVSAKTGKVTGQIRDVPVDEKAARVDPAAVSKATRADRIVTPASDPNAPGQLRITIKGHEGVDIGAVLRGAVVVVTDTKTGKAEKIPVSEPLLELSRPPGDYLVEAASRMGKAEAQKVTMPAGGVLELTLLIL